MNYKLSKSFHNLFTQFGISRLYATKYPPMKVAPEKIHLKKMKSKPLYRDPRSIFHQEIQEMSGELDNLSIDQLEDLTSQRRLQMKFLEKKEKLKTIERRYFKSNVPCEPNLLTWDMKEHLLHLNTSDPDSWNPATLSQSFPISHKEVIKLLKSPNKPPTAEKLKIHDLKVLENWKNLTDGKIGNLKLLKKVVDKRISGLSPETLPSVSGNSEERFAALDRLIFSPTDDLFAPENPHLKRHPKMKRYSFKSIITDYEEKTSQLRGEGEKEIGKCQDLSVAFPQQRETESAHNVRIRSSSSPITRKSAKKLLRGRLTWEEVKRIKYNK